PLIWPHTRHLGEDFRELMQFLRLGPESRVLDVGTSACWSSRLMAETQARVVAIDVVDTPFNGLQTGDIQIEAHGVYFDRVFESMTRLPIADGSCDHVVCVASFHHSPDPVKTLQECSRVLKPGGSVALLHEIVPSLRYMLMSVQGTQEHNQECSSHQDISPATLERYLKHTDFSMQLILPKRVRRRICQPFPGWLGTKVGRFLEAFPQLMKHVNSSMILLHKPG
ncbi:MAG: class I SAM-dependent methyltransferase, partial [Myxococcota bacterium]